MNKKYFRIGTVLLVCAFSLVKASQAIPSFTKEAGIRLSTASPQAILLSGSIYRMYVTRDYEVLSATSSDQLTWTEESGVRLSSPTINIFGGTSPITGCDLLPLTAGGFRMLFSVGLTTGPFGIFIATSTDGLSFGAPSVSTAVFISTGGTFVGSPKLTKLSDGSWRLYYVQDSNGGNDSVDKSIYTALSTDEGVSWSTPTLVLSGPAGEIALSTRTDQKLRVTYTAPISGSAVNSTLLSALSDTAITKLSVENGVRLSTDNSIGSISFPVVVRSTSTDNFRYRVFYNYSNFNSTTTPSIFSALTTAPDPQSISPSEVLTTAVARTFTIRGEIFSSTPTVKLSMTGQSDIIGTSVSRVDDQTITVSLNPLAAEIGPWTVVVTNADGQSGTGTGVLNITFAPAYVVLTDNLLRPGRGPDTQIDVTIFNPGKVKVRLFTMEGQLIETLLDQDEPIGTAHVTWNGKNSSGGTVASGVYLVTFEGPKLNTKQKIVVIR